MRLPVRPGWWLPVWGVLLVGTVVLAAQEKAPADGSMRELVAEVRALRLAVERTAAVTARTQALLGRVQLQESRLADLGRRLDEARQRVRASASQETALVTELEGLTTRLQDTALVPDERGHVETALKMMRARLKMSQDEVARLRVDEQDVLAALSGEQARWSDYNARLEAIEQDVAVAGARKP